MFLCVRLILVHIIVCFEHCSSQPTNIGKSVLLTGAATDKGAVCLDGSAARYYINTNVTEPQKFVMFIEGGGWCSGLYTANGKGFNACWHRSTTDRGSTLNDTETHDLNSVGFLENNQQTNPLFFSWTKIFVRYCDGASFSGDVEQPLQDINDPNKSLFFRGKRILDAVFESLLQDYHLNNVTDFVFGGGSAGGLAVFLHSNYIVNKYFDLNHTKFVALPDVGFFIDYNDDERRTNYSDAMKWIFKNQNVSSSSILSPYCFEHHANDTSKCIFAQNIARDIRIPTFVLNSQFDEWQATYILGTNVTNPALLNEYGRNFTRIIFNDFLLQNQYNGNIYGAFIDSCYHHDSQHSSFTELYIDNYTQSSAFKQFYDSLGRHMNNTRNIWYDSDVFPCHQCCHRDDPNQSSNHHWYHSIFGTNLPSNIVFDIFIVCLIVVTGLLLIGILFWCGWLKGCTDVIWNACCCGRYTQIQQSNCNDSGDDDDGNPEIEINSATIHSHNILP